LAPPPLCVRAMSIIIATRRCTRRVAQMSMPILYPPQLSSEEGNDVFRIHFVVEKHDEDGRVVDVVDGAVIADSRHSIRSLNHILVALRELPSQHSRLDHVLEPVVVLWRVILLSRVREVTREIHSQAVQDRCTSEHDILGHFSQRMAENFTSNAPKIVVYISLFYNPDCSCLKLRIIGLE